MSESPKIEIKTKFGTAILHLHNATAGYVETGNNHNPDGLRDAWEINGIAVRGWGHVEKIDGGPSWEFVRGYSVTVKRVGGRWEDTDKISYNLLKKFCDEILEKIRVWSQSQGAVAETLTQATHHIGQAKREDDEAERLENQAKDLKKLAAANRKQAESLKAVPAFLFEKVEGAGNTGGAGR